MFMPVITLLPKFRITSNKHVSKQPYKVKDTLKIFDDFKNKQKRV